MSGDRTTPRANDNDSNTPLTGSTPTSVHSLSQSERGRHGCFSMTPDGGFTFTFPHSNTRVGLGTPAHQPVSRSQTPSASLPSDGDGQDASRRTGPLRLMTDEGLESALDHINDPQLGAHRSSPGADDIEAWVEASRRTIINKAEKREGDQEVVEKQHRE